MEIQISNWEKTLKYGNYYNNYSDDEIEETIIHTQYIGDINQYVLVQSTIVGPGRDYQHFQIWTYEDLEESAIASRPYDRILLNELVEEWER